MIGSGIFKGLAFGGMEVGEGLIKSGGSIKELYQDVKAGGFINGNFKNGMKYAKAGVSGPGLGLGLLFGAAAAASAPRGKTATRGFSVMTATLAADVIGGAVGGPLGAFLAQSTIQPLLQAAIEKPLEAFSDLHRTVTHVDTGGNYQDSEVAWTMRQRAAQEMGKSLLNARQYLGREAAMFHQ